MGSDDLLKKRRAARTKRKYGYKTTRANSYLIVTEGKRTEPYYFKGLRKMIVEKIGGTVNVVEVPQIEISGEGCSTGKLIEITNQIVKMQRLNIRISGLYLIKMTLKILMKQ